MIEWRAQTGKYQNGDDGYLGKYKTFSLFWDSTRPQNSEEGPYRLACSLPGIKSTLGNHATIEDGKGRAESVLKLWLRNVGFLELIEAAKEAWDAGEWCHLEIRDRLAKALTALGVDLEEGE